MGISAAFLKSKHRIMPGTQTVTYHPKVTDGSGTWSTSESVINAEKRPLRAEDQQAAGILLDQRACTFHVWNENITATPTEGDKLVDADSVTWHVLRVDRELLEQRFRLTCVAERT